MHDSFPPSYTVTAHIGRGGLADVYIARDARGDRVALKRLRREARSALHRRLLRAEATLLSSMRHRNIVAAVDISGVYQHDCLALEYVHGVSLGTLWRIARTRRTRLRIDVAVAIVAEVAAGLHYAHDLELAPGVVVPVVHRDVSPKNILVGLDGTVKLADFGVARIGPHPVRERRMVVGKPGYIAPEQCTGGPVDRRSDVFSLGVILFELTTGQLLFRGRSDTERMYNTVRGVPLLPSHVCQAYPTRLEAILARALARDPDDRYPTAAAMLSDLLEFQCLDPADARARIAATTNQLVRPARRRRRRPTEPTLAMGSGPLTSVAPLRPFERRVVEAACRPMEDGRFADAAAAFTDLAKTRPGDLAVRAGYYAALGCHEARAGNRAAAERCLDVALELAPASSHPWASIAALCAAESKLDGDLFLRLLEASLASARRT